MGRFVDVTVLLLAGLKLGRAAPTPTLSERASPAGLRGPESLLGFSAGNKISQENTDNVNVQLAPGQTDDATLGQFLDFSDIPDPQPIRGTKGGIEPFNFEANDALNQIYSDKLAPPGTDNGGTINAQWSMAASHTSLGLGRAGFSRQENVVVMPAADDFAGVMMRLEEGAYRELHWHVASEWSMVLNGSARIAAINENGESFIDDVSAGDVWFFPAGVPHSIQGLEGGVEFLLVFDDGEFSEDNTFLVTEVFAHNPKDVLAQNFGIDVSALDNLPTPDLFIFPGTPAPADIEAQNITNSNGVLPTNMSYSYHFSEQAPLEVAGGSVKILDSQTFPIAPNFAAALVTIKPGAMREIHWHPTSDEWSFCVAGSGRATLFQAESSANTFNFNAGDVGYFPQSASHYVQNTGDTDMIFLEVLNADHFSDIALGQWIATTPPQILTDTLKLSNATVQQMSVAKEKQYVIPSGGPVAQPILSEQS